MRTCLNIVSFQPWHRFAKAIRIAVVIDLQGERSSFVMSVIVAMMIGLVNVYAPIHPSLDPMMVVFRPITAHYEANARRQALRHIASGGMSGR